MLDAASMTIGCKEHLTVVPSDTIVFDPPLRALYCNTDGQVSLMTHDKIVCPYTFKAGQRLDGFWIKVLATGWDSSSTFNGQR